ncbi:MAG TPA: BON domain-containing protein [Terriglobales bacterium]|nr:BON domain-containing protein [Terriglobales bacterium]
MRTKQALFVTFLLALGLALVVGCSHKVERTDAQVASDVQNKIYSDPGIQSRGISVQAANGVVTLSGDVTSDAERTAAANDAGAIDGVKTVVNNLQVQQAQVTPPPPPVEQPAEKPQPRTEKKSSETAQGRRHSKPSVSEAGNSSAETEQASNNAPPPPQPASQQVQPPAPPLPPPPPQKVTIPAGTQLSVRLNDPLDSERNKVGDSFHGSLSAPIVIDGETVIPQGADVVGRVANVQSAGRFAGSSLLTLELTSLSVNGRTYNIQTNQWSRQGKGEGKSTATKVGVGAAAGAILGGLIGGGKGAAIGAASGAGAGTGVAAAKKGEQIKLAPEAVLNFQIINALTVVPQESNDRNAGRSPLS